jgi:glyoxylase-like metal-dependent hydrolase (beta-lactamase superfamily II)
MQAPYQLVSAAAAAIPYSIAGIHQALIRSITIASAMSDLPTAAVSTPPSGLVFRQLFESVSSTYTYILGDETTGEALIIDPVLEKAGRDAKLAAELGLRLVVAINTHVHADHVSGTSKLKRLIPGLRSGVAAVSRAAADICLTDGDTVAFGCRHIKVLSQYACRRLSQLSHVNSCKLE